MSELRKANTDYPYFVTFTVVGWIDVFTRSRYCDVIIESLKFCQQNKGLEVFAYVIVPSHVHLIVRQLDGKLYNTIRDFKSYTAKRIIEMIENEQGESRKDWLLHLFKYHAKFKKQNSKYMFWQKTNHPIELSNTEVFKQKVEYIHDNPVSANLVNSPESWVYSSLNLMNEVELIPIVM